MAAFAKRQQQEVRERLAAKEKQKTAIEKIQKLRELNKERERQQ